MCLLELLKQDANNHVALLMLGGSYFIDEKYSEAEMVFERIILMEPGEGKFSIALFNTLCKSDRTEEALEEIKRFMSTADAAKEKETFDQYMKITDSIADDLDPSHN
jgi:predicted Zn-dependent protease